MIGAIPTEARGPKRKVGPKEPLRCAEREGSEEAKYASICVSVLANPKPYMASGIFDLSVFWSGQKSVIPVHYSLWMAEVGCAKVASANVETVFSGAGRISMKSHCLGPASPDARGNCRCLHETLW